MRNMFRGIVSALVLVMLAAPAAAQEEIVREVANDFPHLLQANTPAGNGEVLYRVVERLGAAVPGRAGWVLIAKSGGENGVTWSNGVRTSHDAICRVNDRGEKTECYDIIAAARGDRDGPLPPAAPSWGEISSHEWRASNTPVPLSALPRLGGPSAPPPNTGPFPGGDWTARHADVLVRFGAGATTQAVAEQFAYSFPDEGWGQKAADPSRPLSEDVIARRYDSGRLVGFRVVPPSAHPMQFDLAGQHFVPVAGVDHLGIGTRPAPPVEPPTPPIEPGPPPTPPATDLQPLLDAIAALTEKVGQLEGTINGFGTSVLPALARIEQVLDAQPTAPPGAWPEYVGSILGRTVVLSPRAPR